MEGMRDYPGNDHALDRLREIVASGQGVAFVGAGASAGLYPLWGQLIDVLIGEAERRGRPAQECDYWRRTALSDPQLVAGGLKRRLGAGHFEKPDSIGRTDLWSPAGRLVRLATTNLLTREVMELHIRPTSPRWFCVGRSAWSGAGLRGTDPAPGRHGRPRAWRILSVA